jgi:hypothetical protein
LQSSKNNTGKEWLRDKNYNLLSSSRSQELENDWLHDKHVWCHNFSLVYPQAIKLCGGGETDGGCESFEIWLY